MDTVIAEGLQSAFASAAGVSVSDVSISVRAASVAITAVVSVPSNTTAAAVSSRLSSSMGTAASASAALGLTVVSEPLIVASHPQSSSSSTFPIAAVVSGGAGAVSFLLGLAIYLRRCLLGLAICLRRRRQKQLHGGPMRVQPVVSEGAINPPGHWDFFLSHTQRDPLAVMLAEVLCNELAKMGKTVWLDVHMTKRAWASWNYLLDTVSLYECTLTVYVH